MPKATKPVKMVTGKKLSKSMKLQKQQPLKAVSMGPDLWE
jgi:hypothetical protein